MNIIRMCKVSGLLPRLLILYCCLQIIGTVDELQDSEKDKALELLKAAEIFVKEQDSLHAVRFEIMEILYYGQVCVKTSLTSLFRN